MCTTQLPLSLQNGFACLFLLALSKQRCYRLQEVCEGDLLRQIDQAPLGNVAFYLKRTLGRSRWTGGAADGDPRWAEGGVPPPRGDYSGGTPPL